MFDLDPKHYGCLKAFLKVYNVYVMFYSYVAFQWLHSAWQILSTVVNYPNVFLEGLIVHRIDGTYVCPPWLCVLTMIALVACFLTILIAGIHSARHLLVMHRYKHGQLAAMDQRNSLLIVIGLPVVYAVASLRSVSYFWGLYVEKAWENTEFEKAADLALESYKTVSGVADLYESYAMFQFVDLSLSEIRRSLKNMYRDDPSESGLHNLLMDVLSALTMLGVYSFISTCALSATFDIASQNYIWLIRGSTCGSGLNLLSKGKSFFYAMGWATSSLAIVNVVQVEAKFERYIPEFHAYKKFASTKVMVSVTFMQSAVLSIASGFLPEPKLSYTYCVLLIIEVFILACYNIWAWPPMEEWLRVSQAIVLKTGRHLKGFRQRSNTAGPEFFAILEKLNSQKEDPTDALSLQMLKIKCPCRCLATLRNFLCFKWLRPSRKPMAEPFLEKEASRSRDLLGVSNRTVGTSKSWPHMPFSPSHMRADKMKMKRQNRCLELVYAVCPRCCRCCKRQESDSRQISSASADDDDPLFSC